jgi:hypothetical protein
MTRSDDPRADMVDVGRLDAGTAERLLSGLMDPDDAPPALAGVAELVRALVAPPTRVELAGEAAAVAAASAFVTPPLERVKRAASRSSRGRTGSSSLRTKVASLAFAGTLLGTTGLAAAGVLPDPVQEVAHRILSKVGIDVPGPSDHRPADPEDETDRPPGAGPGDEDGGQGPPGWVVGPTPGGSHNQIGGNGGSGNIHGRDEDNRRNDDRDDHREDGDDHVQGGGNHDGSGGSGNGHDETNGNANRNGHSNTDGNPSASDGGANVNGNHGDLSEPGGVPDGTDEHGNANGGDEESR